MHSIVKAELMRGENHQGGLPGGGEASKVRKEGMILVGGKGRTAQVGKWPELRRMLEKRGMRYHV